MTAQGVVGSSHVKPSSTKTISSTDQGEETPQQVTLVPSTVDSSNQQ